MSAHGSESGRRTLQLSLAALGVVYGDIGTSPIYALRECFHGSGGLAPTPDNVLGVLSLVIWSLVLVISVKYLAFIMRADNRGEGGIAALLALLNPWRAKRGSKRYILMLLGLFGAALLYGDGTITPAISVLSAVEGLEVATPRFAPFVIPITLVILLGLFWLQKRGTGDIGVIFGPVIALWFVVLMISGGWAMSKNWQVLAAFDPRHALQFFLNNGHAGFVALGAVFLAVTGGEALYADMGHFGRRPIRIAWFTLALPALLINYLGQGALILADPEVAKEPFYSLVDGKLIYPLIGLATLATIIASQAVISGVFSLTGQFVQLGQLPRLNIVQTSADEQGQIYIPFVNWILMLATIGLVLSFRSSSALASAYGIAVATTMVVTTVLAFFVARRFDWSLWMAGLSSIVFMIPDTAFFAANLLKIKDGGWYPVLLALIIFVLMTTWARGRQVLDGKWDRHARPLTALVEEIRRKPPFRIDGTAVFFTSTESVPPHLFRHLRRHRVLQRDLLLLTVRIEDEPRVPATERLKLIGICPGVTRIIVRYGFMQEANVPMALRLSEKLGLDVDLDNLTYYVGRATLIPVRGGDDGMAPWREHLFAFVMRNALPATAYFRLPPEDVVELGFQVEI